ncbi:MAG: protein kinase [Verrucomicrobia bacterium]|nr:protein kinase [Verrucomicrobiota bacterium]
MSACAVCGSHLRNIDGLCPGCLARSITPFLGQSSASGVPGYHLHEAIGAGGMGIVFAATHVSDCRKVAIKWLPDHLADDDEFATRLLREAEALAALDHPHVLRVLDSGVTPDGRVFLVTEFAPGGDLAQRLRQGPVPVEDALRMFREVLGAVEAAHVLGMVHRDLKPANILLDAGGSVRVADFSLAKLSGDGEGPRLSLTRETDVFGTPYYIAPEGRQGSAGVDQRVDIFSLGVLLHELLTGRIPIGRYEPSSRLAKVPRGMDRIIARCLSESPEKRFQTVASLRQALEASLAPRPVGRALAVLAGVFLLALGLSGRFPLGGRGPAPSPRVASPSRPWTNTLGMQFVPVPGTGTLFSVWETRRSDFAVFVRENPGPDGDQVWEHPEGAPGPDHPVSWVSWLRAEQFCDWLTRKEHAGGALPRSMRYRLPRDWEWSLAAGLSVEPGGTPEERTRTLIPSGQAPYPWGNFWPPPPEGIQANFAGQEAAQVVPPFARPVLRHRDDWPRTAPVGTFAPNRFHLFDLSGNVAEWCLDEWNGQSPDKTVRGGAHNQTTAPVLRLDGREHLSPRRQLPGIGFRVVIETGT